MSISFTLLNKFRKERKVQEVVSAFCKAVNDNYTISEKEGYVTKQGKSCLSVLFQASEFKSKNRPDMIIHKVCNQSSSLVLVKKVVELEGFSGFGEELASIDSPFVVLELTRMISRLEMRPPWILTGGQMIFPVGMIGAYFMATEETLYKNDSRGLEFARGFTNKDQSVIATAYYDKFINHENTQDLTDPEISGLSHFTTIISLTDREIQFCFLQNQMMAARYFFKPDIFFCSNEIVARSIRHILYPNQNIQLRNRLRFYEDVI